MPDAYAELCASMIADLQAQLPIAREDQKAEIRRAISRWRKAAKRPAPKPAPEPKKRRKPVPPGQWRLGAR